MIEFKVIATPDKSQQASYRHEGHELTIGSAEGDMIIDDPNMSPLQLHIRGGASGYSIENVAPDVEVRLNGKPISGAVPLKERDNLTIGRTTINFSRLDMAALSPPEPFEIASVGTRLAPGTKEHAILAVLDILAAEAGAAAPAGGPPKPPVPGGGLPRAPGAPPPLPRR